jgi:hypothetical protein
MCLEVRTCDSEVIQVAGEREASQNPVHHLRKTDAHILKTKWHPFELEEYKGSDDSCFLPVLWPNRDLPVALPMSILENTLQPLSLLEKSNMLDRGYTWPHGAILFGHHMQGRGPGDGSP